jgi:capsular exopolysaccharide synthesis family protein
MSVQSVPLISYLDPKSPVVEAYRTLRTNLKYTDVGSPLRKVLVTSPGPGEGKSTITANLAVVLAQSGQRVIAASVDLRKPMLHRYIGLSNQLGVTTILAGQATLADCLQDTGVENMRFLASGPHPPNPAELLSSQRMQELLIELQERADIILFDAPPIVAVTDAAVLAPHMDGVLLVVNVGTVPREMAIRSKEQLLKVGARLLGVVLNRVDSREGYGYYYYYYYYGEGTSQTRSAGE